jgi:hypothetical protein
MRFRLLFEGEIPPRQQTSLQVVHDIRLKLAPQLAALWRFSPLDEMWKWLKHPQENPMDYGILARLRLRPTRRVGLWLRSPVHDELW